MFQGLREFLNSILVNPKTGESSLTALFAIISFIVCVVACFLEMFEYAKSTSIAVELFLVCMGSYLGRRIDFPNKKDKTIEPQ